MPNQQITKRENHNLKFKVAAIVAGALTGIILLPFATTVAQEIGTSTTPTSVFSIPTTEATSSIAVYDIQSKEFIYEKNSSEVRPLASLVKMMTAMVAKDIVEGKSKTITLRNIDKNSRIDRSLQKNEKWNLNDLIYFMLMTSSNTAAESIANGVFPYSSFISLMNHKAKNIGLETFKASNASGLTIQKTLKGKKTETPGAVGTAKDIALMMATAYEDYPELINYSSTYQMTFTSKLYGKAITHIATSTNSLLASSTNIIGSKTGYTEASGGNIAVIVKTPQDRPVVIVVLGSTVANRLNEVIAFASSTTDFFTIK